MKHHASLIASLIIAIVMIGAVVGSIYLPQLFIKPQTDFVYMIKDTYSQDPVTYFVDNGKVRSDTTAGELVMPDNSALPQFYRYNVTNNQSQQLTAQQIQRLTLDNRTQSDDGFTVGNGQSETGGVWPFFTAPASDDSAWYVQGHGVSHRLNLPVTANDWEHTFVFLGWVKG